MIVQGDNENCIFLNKYYFYYTSLVSSIIIYGKNIPVSSNYYQFKEAGIKTVIIEFIKKVEDM